MGRGHKAKNAKKKPKNSTRFKKVPRQKNNNACMTSDVIARAIALPLASESLALTPASVTASAPPTALASAPPSASASVSASSPAPPPLQTTLPAALAEAALYRVPSLCFDATLPASDRGYQQVERSVVWSLVLDCTQWKSHHVVAKLIKQYYRALDIHPVKNWKNPRLLLPRSLARMAQLLAEATRAVGPQEECR